MARGSIAVLSSMVSNPYPRPKEHTPMYTTCELCDRTIFTKDWNGHKNSKKHREAEAKEKVPNESIKENDFGSFGGGSAGFTADTGASTGDSWGGGDTFSATTTTADASWGATDFINNAGFGTSNTGGGGDRACYGCGQTGHQKRDCHSGSGGGGGDRSCYGCGQTGHQKRDCPSGGGSGGGNACFNCGETGHRKMDCTAPRKPYGGGGGGSDRACFNCGQTGHNKSDCTEPMKASGGAGRTCHNCKQEGHLSKDCPEPRVMRCRNCEDEGHQSRECSKPTDWSKIKCRNCEQYGHGAGRCPNQPVEAADNGWGNVDGGASKAAGGWASGGGDAAIPELSTGNWADDTNAAAAAAGDSWGGAVATGDW